MKKSTITKTMETVEQALESIGSTVKKVATSKKTLAIAAGLGAFLLYRHFTTKKTTKDDDLDEDNDNF